MDRLIKCSEDYNPYKIIDRLSSVLMNDYSFELHIKPDVLDNSYVHNFDSGNLRISITNNAYHDMFFHIDIDNARHSNSMYKRSNLRLDDESELNSLIEKFKNAIHQYKDDLKIESRRAVMIASITE